MRAYFADTSYYIGLLVPGDETHAAVKAVSPGLNGKIVTTEFVVLELAAYFAAPPFRGRFAAWMEGLRRDPDVLILPVSAELFDGGWKAYCDHADKDWSLTDCISFHVMRERKISEALTSDHHFQQAGFDAMVRKRP